MNQPLHTQPALASGSTLTVYAPLPDSDRCSVTQTDASGNIWWSGTVSTAAWREEVALLTGVTVCNEVTPPTFATLAPAHQRCAERAA